MENTVSENYGKMDNKSPKSARFQSNQTKSDLTWRVSYTQSTIARRFEYIRMWKNDECRAVKLMFDEICESE